MRRLAFVLAILVCAAVAARAEDAVLVLDESGSMWGQIEGKTKVEIARNVIAELLGQVPDERRLGLVAYGHRREGDCADIEEVVPVGADRSQILARVNALKPKGKTPLTEGVRFAARTLHYTEQKATVILVSDGAESCNADPCALGRELEAAGVDFTAHVIGFGLASDTESAGLRCLAEATGGRYFAAADAAQLSAALVATVAAPPPPVEEVPSTARVTLRATELDGGPELGEGLDWRIATAQGESVFSQEHAGVLSTEIAPGSYVAEVKRPGDGLSGSASFEVKAGGERTVTIALEFPLTAKLSLGPATSAAAASTVKVSWEGPDREGDFITVVAPDEPPTAYRSYAYTRDGNPASIQVPVDPGDYQLRYVLGRPQRVLATLPIAVSAVSATIEAAPEIAAGSPFPVSWSGPNTRGDWLTIVKPDAANTDYASYVNADTASPGTLQAPIEQGSYELRYVAQGTNVIARRPISVVEVGARIDAPESVAAGSDFAIEWQGPNNNGDWLTIVQPEVEPTGYASYVNADYTGAHTLTAPLEPGAYEIRYVAQGTKVLARKPITIRAVTASIEAPATVGAGATFQLSWQGPNNSGDWLTIVEPDAADTTYASYVDVNEASTGMLTAPEQAGIYELRYVQGNTKVLARRPIEVTAAP